MISREYFIEGSTALRVLTIINELSASGTDPLPLTQANTFTGRASPADGGAAVDLAVTVSNAAAGKVAVDPSPLTAGEWSVQISFFDTAGRKHTYPDTGNGLRFVVGERL